MNATRYIALAILFAVVVAVSEAGADLVPGRVDSAGAASGKNAPLVDEYPSLQPWINTSPYAHEPISISPDPGSVCLRH